MPKSNPLVQPVQSSAKRAMVFICEKCGKRIGKSSKDVSRRLASHFKQQVKREFDKGDVRIVLTSCMDICPDECVTVAIQPNAPGIGPTFLIASIDDIEASSEALVGALRRATAAIR
jgi:predicted metal-binding protein